MSDLRLEAIRKRHAGAHHCCGIKCETPQMETDLSVLLTELDRVTQERDEHHAKVLEAVAEDRPYPCQPCYDAQQKYVTLQARVKQLEKYAVHKDFCAKYAGNPKCVHIMCDCRCSCDLDTLRAND